MIYLLTVRKGVYYDSYDAKVIRACNETEARKIANKTIGDEGKVWEDRIVVSCKIVEEVEKSKPILESYCAG